MRTKKRYSLYLHTDLMDEAKKLQEIHCFSISGLMDAFLKEFIKYQKMKRYKIPMEKIAKDVADKL